MVGMLGCTFQEDKRAKRAKKERGHRGDEEGAVVILMIRMASGKVIMNGIARGL
ncbi:hypothetical protein [Bifidobacterium crudilactis]|jgi:hypothetical protein|uniref:hypothetical protein n=1 Tax=Bifidobacterium crudilactis TaxID=327277 RepID=UPI000ACD18D2|nr:hypothetical protein [Bifidobacterium crudilactis]MCI2149086.1 hypothetical protein [Bifidobacterium crudilactis]MCI2158621.1 hypothetical protein [Bifidobacterium crudilactis]